MLPIFSSWLSASQSILVPLCFVLAWTLAILSSWTLWRAVAATAARAKQMHQIPCTGCQFFTNDYRLKCTVHPAIANTENAIDCSDYHPRANPFAT